MFALLSPIRRAQAVPDSTLHDVPSFQECPYKPAVLQERGIVETRLLKQCGGAKKDKKSRNPGYGDRLSEEEMDDYEARIVDRCEMGKDCCIFRILEARRSSDVLNIGVPDSVNRLQP
jgi:hypothetical protein